ncbi:MAG: hypothetical protein IKW19_00690 [Akkermansia sp.]|nr:hypothetical protein [Akkermansia sp.]MBR5184790.1 hypothetical protein [Akkermansia sp.]
MNTIVIKEGRLRELLFELLACAKMTRFDQYDRPWCISFPYGNYGKPDMAVCELRGSPVKRTVLVAMNEGREVAAIVAGACFDSTRRVKEYKHHELLKELRKEIKCLYEKIKVCGFYLEKTDGPYEVIEGADDPDCMFFYIVNNNVETYIGLPEEVARFVYGTGYTPDKETARKRATVYCRLLNALYRENQVCGCDGKEQEDGH